MWARTASMSGSSFRCRSWFTLSGPMVITESRARNQSTLRREPPKNARPAPAKVTLEVEANCTTLSSRPPPGTGP